MQAKSSEGYCFECPIQCWVARHKSQFLNDDGTLGNEEMGVEGVDFQGDLSFEDIEEGLSALNQPLKLREALRSGVSDEELTRLRVLADNLLIHLGEAALEQDCPGPTGDICGISISQAPTLAAVHDEYKRRLENNMIA